MRAEAELERARVRLDPLARCVHHAAQQRWQRRRGAYARPLPCDGVSDFAASVGCDASAASAHRTSSAWSSAAAAPSRSNGAASRGNLRSSSAVAGTAAAGSARVGVGFGDEPAAQFLVL